MRGTKAKRLRRLVYGDLAPSNRLYRVDHRTGRIEADPLRRRYQREKGR